jgi:hypothetical protein
MSVQAEKVVLVYDAFGSQAYTPGKSQEKLFTW